MMPKYWIQKFLLISAYSLIFFSLIGQDFDYDQDLLASKTFTQPQFEKHKVVFLTPVTNNIIIKYNPVTLALGGAMYIYQRFISAQLSRSCLYEISCSRFSKELIKEFGYIKGTALTADRLMRCNRMASLDINDLKLNPHTHKVIETTSDFKKTD